MAQLLIKCLSSAGYKVDIASRLRVFFKKSDDQPLQTTLMEQAEQEIQRLTQNWQRQEAPALWFCYHPYYKSPDLIGPPLCQAFDIPYVTAEATYSARRNAGVWKSMQAQVLESVNRAAVNLCFTKRDRIGLRNASPTARLDNIRPFIQVSEYSQPSQSDEIPRLVAVAMMRSGDKMDSYIRLASSLKQLLHLPWSLSIVGDGTCRSDVQTLFADFPADRIFWHGQLAQPEIAELFRRCALYVWPGCGEAYGLAYLEAQAAGLPVVAYNTAGVPEVVEDGTSGMLTPENDDMAYAKAIEHMLTDEQKRSAMADNALAKIQAEHTDQIASSTLKSLLQIHAGLHP